MYLAQAVNLSDKDRDTLERWSRGRTTPLRLVQRARIVLLASAGRSNVAIAAELHVDRQTASRWRRRFAQYGLAGIQKDAPRGRPPVGRELLAQRIVQMTLHEPPPAGRRWTTRTLAAAVGTNRSTVHRVWRACGVNPASNLGLAGKSGDLAGRSLRDGPEEVDVPRVRQLMASG
jgi:transposase